MRRLVACFVLSSLLAASLSGCGDVIFRGTLNSDFSSVSGTISQVTLTTLPQNGTTIVVTIVIFEEVLGFSTVNFCGDAQLRFPMNSFAEVNFQPGQPCSTVIAIFISG